VTRAEVQARSYTPEERARAIGRALVIGDYRASVELGIPRRTVASWRASPEADTYRAQAGRALVEELWQSVIIAHEAIRSRLEQPDTSLRDLAITFGILADKAILLSGGATSRTEHVRPRDEPDDLTDDERDTLARWLNDQLDAGTDAATLAAAVDLLAVDRPAGFVVSLPASEDSDGPLG
jgi:transposase-like protein